MKTLSKAAALLCVSLLPTLAQAMTEPTLNSEEKFYIIEFSNSLLYLTAHDNGSNLTTEAATLSTATDQQLWRLTGESLSSVQLINKAGQYAIYNSSAGYMQAAASADASGWTLEDDNTYWQLKWNGTSSSYCYMNQWAGTGEGTLLGLWSGGDNNDKFILIDPDDPDLPEFQTSPIAAFTPDDPLTLWYDEPATATGVSNIWMEYSLPIGNGQLGACLFGGIMKDEIQFNEKTLWTGTPTDVSSSYGQYKNFGSVFVEDLSETIGFTDEDEAKDYYRSLDIETGVARVHYTNASGGTTYDRTYFSSNPDQVIVARYTASGDDDLALRVTMVPGDDINATNVSYTISSTTGAYYISYMGSLATISYATRLRIDPGEGTVEKTDEGFVVTGTKEMTIFLVGGTSFDSDTSTRKTGETNQELKDRFQDAADSVFAKGYETIYERHLDDFRSLMGRVNLNIGGASQRTTKDLITYYNTLSSYDDPEARFLETLYFQYGRYLEMSSSRGVDVPSNLQGIWNNLSNAPWNSDIHTNINVQMNYWPAEPTNLSETHLPLLNYIIRNAESSNWQKVAKSYAGVSTGWTVFTESNIFGGMSTWGSNYFVANAWYCSHLWQHFRYTRDEEFLAKAFPAMWTAAQFWMERMIEDKGYDSAKQNSSYGGTAYSFEADGTYVAPDEYSPEQDAHSSEDGTAHAQQLIYHLLSSVKQATEILDPAVTGLDDEDIARLDLYLEKTDRGLHTEIYTANTSLNSSWTNPRNGVSKGDTILREWKYSPYDVSSDPSHRHLSHLMALYPLSEIDPQSPYFNPAVRSLMLRGDDATGWSMGWKVNLWARALDGDHAHTILKNALKHSTSYDTNQYAGGVYYNLFDSHAPFQIDGNFGCAAGIAEMLLQSATDTLRLLPALPSTWPTGSMSGMRAVGGFEVAETWEDDTLVTASITSLCGLPCPIKYAGIGFRKVTDSSGEAVPYTRIDENTIVLPTVEGETYVVDMASVFDDVRAPKTTGDESETAFSVARTGNRLSVWASGKEVLSLETYDTAGRLTASAKGATVFCPPTGVALVRVTFADGTTATRKTL